VRDHPQFLAYVALVCVCFFWGTTYLGIRIALESVSPATLMCVRYLLSGGIMLAGALVAGAHLPRGRELWLTAFYGILVIGIGTGSLSFAEQWVPSGLAALMVTITPFWMVGVEALTRGGDKLHGPTVAGMLVGVAGVALLLAPVAGFPGASAPEGQSGLLRGFLLLQVGLVGWSAGAIGQRKLGARAHPIVSGAVQQMATGLVYIVPAILQPQTVHWTSRGVGAVAYLVVFGGIVGYSSFVFAMDRLPVAIASIYSYVNPMVAVALGWLFYREPFGVREAVATAVIFIGVTIVKRTASSVAVQKLGADGPAESG
jgi:drug/metabolite transporter (DMT)-like permease